MSAEALAFIIMQFGNAELDKLCEVAIVPAIEACKLLPRRVDKHNEGQLLKSEIVRFIQNARIIVADLTNERPNVYLEVGYAMGADKFANLILTVREDHSPDSPNHKPGGPRVHFDLAGYDILRWHPDRLDEFRQELEKRIQRRLAIVAPTPVGAARGWNVEWIAEQRSNAAAGLGAISRTGYMEVRASLDPRRGVWRPRELDEAARNAPIHTFGWPIAAYLDRDEFRPKPREDGIVCEIRPEQKDSYDFWALRRDGDFYFLGSLFEDERDRNKLFFNVRIMRVTESLLYVLRLYAQLKVDRSSSVRIGIKHGGVNGRELASSSLGRSVTQRRPAVSPESEVEIETPLDQIEANLVEMVKTVVAPLFELFDFAEFADSVYEDIVNRYVKGEVS